jgi:hypothetical protein
MIVQAADLVWKLFEVTNDSQFFIEQLLQVFVFSINCDLLQETHEKVQLPLW